MVEEIPFGRTVAYVSGEAPPLDAEERPAPAQKPDYWENPGRHANESGAVSCWEVNREAGHGYGPNGRWACTREAGHPGPHVAQADGLSVVAVWEDQ